MKRVAMILVALMAVGTAAACGSESSSSQTPVAVVSNAAPSPVPTSPQSVMEARITEAIADLTAEQLATICEGFKTEPTAVANAFARPLDAAGASHEESTTTVLKVLAATCN